MMRLPIPGQTHETHIPAVQDSAATKIRFFEADAHEKWPRDLASPSPQGAQAPFCVAAGRGDGWTEAGLHGSNTLPKSERLQHGYQFRQVYELGRKIVGKLFVLYVVDAPTGQRRAVGVVTSRRIGGAVTRNRARRLMREAYRLNKQKLKANFLIVMIARSAINGKRLQDVEAELLRLFRVAGVLNET